MRYIDECTHQHWRDWLLFAIIMAACCLGCTPPDGLDATGTCGVVDVAAPETPTPSPEAPPMGPAPAGLWIVGLPVAATQEACRMWSWSGLTCELAASADAAWLTLTAEAEPDCAWDEQGTVQLGSAGWRAVSIHLSCFRGQVGIDPGISGAYTATVAHEIGHALGLDHVEDPEALMHYRLQYQRALNDTDRAEFTRVWGSLSPP